MIFRKAIGLFILVLGFEATAQNNKDWVLPIGEDTVHCDIHKTKNKKLLYTISGGSNKALAFNKLDSYYRDPSNIKKYPKVFMPERDLKIILEVKVSGGNQYSYSRQRSSHVYYKFTAGGQPQKHIGAFAGKLKPYLAEDPQTLKYLQNYRTLKAITYASFVGAFAFIIPALVNTGKEEEKDDTAILIGASAFTLTGAIIFQVCWGQLVKAVNTHNSVVERDQKTGAIFQLSPSVLQSENTPALGLTLKVNF